MNCLFIYLIIIIYLLKNLECSKTELNMLVNDFEKSINDFRAKVPMNIYSSILYTDTKNKINLLKNLKQITIFLILVFLECL